MQLRSLFLKAKGKNYVVKQNIDKVINDLNQTINFCKVHYFAHDTNLLHFNRSIAKFNKCFSLDTENLNE